MINGDNVSAIAVQTNGQIIVGGSFTAINGYSELGWARLNSDGTLDTGFHISPGANPAGLLVIQSDQKILNSNGPQRFNTDGSLDSSFSPAVSGIEALAIQPDGKILIAGDFQTVNGTNAPTIARLVGDAPGQAQTQLLNMNLYPGMFLAGSVGSGYLIEYTTNLNTPSLWTPLTNVVLSNSPMFIVDPTQPQASRFYRAVALP